MSDLRKKVLLKHTPKMAFNSIKFADELEKMISLPSQFPIKDSLRRDLELSVSHWKQQTGEPVTDSESDSNSSASSGVDSDTGSEVLIDNQPLYVKIFCANVRKYFPKLAESIRIREAQYLCSLFDLGNDFRTRVGVKKR